MNISVKYHIPAKKLDFVNVNLTKDNRLFIDPLRIMKGNTDFHKKCYFKIQCFVNIMIKLARNKEYNKLLEYIDNFYERNETKLGYSIETVYGKSFGENGGTDLVKLLSRNTALESGFVEDIFDFLIMVPNIGEDKVSDIITTIIFLDLVEYTQSQCNLWEIPTETVKIDKLCWDAEKETWKKIEVNLPVYSNKPIVFVPKSFVGQKYLFSYEQLYREVVIPLYKDLELKDRNSKFVVKYKNGRVHVLGNELRKKYPCTKYVILDFVKKYDLLYREYKSKVIGN